MDASSSASSDADDDDDAWNDTRSSSRTRVHASVDKYVRAATVDGDDADGAALRRGHHSFLFRDALVGVIDALAREDAQETTTTMTSPTSPAMGDAASHVWALRRAARRARGGREASTTRTTSASVDDVRRALRDVRDACDIARDEVRRAVDGYASKMMVCAREGAKAKALEAAAVTAGDYVFVIRKTLAMRTAVERGAFERACALKDSIDSVVRSMGSAVDGLALDGALERASDEGCRCASDIRARAKRLVTGWFTRARERAQVIGRAAISHSVNRARKLAARAARIEACTQAGLADADADCDDDCDDDEDIFRMMIDDLDPSSVFRAHALCLRLGETPEEFSAWMRSVRAEQLKRDSGTPLEGAIGYFIIQLALVDDGIILSRDDVDAEWAIAVREFRANILRTDGTEAARVASETRDACACAQSFGFDAGALLDASRALEIMCARRAQTQTAQ